MFIVNRVSGASLHCINFGVATEPACADGQLLVMVHGLSQELSENPAIYTGDDHTLWIYFPHSCFVCDGLMEDYGIPGALILREFPFPSGVIPRLWNRRRSFVVWRKTGCGWS